MYDRSIRYCEYFHFIGLIGKRFNSEVKSKMKDLSCLVRIH